MKKLLLCAFILSTITSNAQSVFGQSMGLNDGHLLRNKVIDYKDATIDGSPYIEKNFFYAEIEGIEGGMMMRYNAHRDEYEIKKNEGDPETFSLPKEERYSVIKGKFNNKVIKLKEFQNKNKENTRGYLEELHRSNKVAFYKRERVILQKEREGNGYQGYIPPKFSKGTTEYYLENNDGKISEFPTNKKELIKLYPAKKSEIDAFIKANKIKFGNEESMVSIVNFLSK